MLFANSAMKKCGIFDKCDIDMKRYDYKHSSFGRYVLSPGPEVIKNIMLSSAEHEILNVPKYENIKQISFFRLRYA